MCKSKESFSQKYISPWELEHPNSPVNIQILNTGKWERIPLLRHAVCNYEIKATCVWCRPMAPLHRVTPNQRSRHPPSRENLLLWSWSSENWFHAFPLCCQNSLCDSTLSRYHHDVPGRCSGFLVFTATFSLWQTHHDKQQRRWVGSMVSWTH